MTYMEHKKKMFWKISKLLDIILGYCLFYVPYNYSQWGPMLFVSFVFSKRKKLIQV